MDIYSADFIITILVNLVLTILGYCTVPIILRLKNGKYEYKKGHKIILINCAIVWVIFAIIKIEQGLDATGGAVFLYYFVNRAILLKPKEDTKEIKGKENYSLFFENEKIEKAPRLTYVENLKLQKSVEQIEEKQLDNLIEQLEQEKIVEPMEGKKQEVEQARIVEKVVEIKEDKTILYVVIGILAVTLIGVGIYAFCLSGTYESKIEYLESQISNLKTTNSKLNDEKYDTWRENLDKSVKASFLDENIVFVIDGYGNYYYTYDQMEQVTQGVEKYSYWAYNKEQAISRGYKAWK